MQQNIENMNLDFIKEREKRNLIPLEIKDKMCYHLDLINIEDSWSGRMDAQVANTFIQESAQLIINSIALFEQGYFDAAFYSLRQSLEVSTTMTYLIDNEYEFRKKELSKWKNQKSFPMYNQMLTFLEANETVFSDIKKKLKEYFEELDVTKRMLNKYVHKQGFNTLYISRNHPLNKNNDNKVFIDEFETYLKKCIGAIAIFRLTIDPFPILLNDENIYSRTNDLMTRGYDNDFIDKYIGQKYIDLYKETEMYINHYESIIQEEVKNEFVLAVVKNQYIDKLNIPSILSQKHLLNQHDLIAVNIIGYSEKIAKVYCLGGLFCYFSSTNSNRTVMSWSSEEFNNFKNNENRYNQKYDEAFISCIFILKEYYFIEHNQIFNDSEINDFKIIEGTQHTTAP